MLILSRIIQNYMCTHMYNLQCARHSTCGGFFFKPHNLTENSTKPCSIIQMRRLRLEVCRWTCPRSWSYWVREPGFRPHAGPGTQVGDTPTLTLVGVPRCLRRRRDRPASQCAAEQSWASRSAGQPASQRGPEATTPWRGWSRRTFNHMSAYYRSCSGAPQL